jgi:uncharacterized protein YndB with AHSA1/START domain
MSPDAATAELRRRLAAAPEQVFAAFADAALVARWLRPAPEIGLTVEVFDFRVSGAYRFVYHVPYAGVVRIGGRFRVIDRPSRIVFSWIIEPPDEHAGIDSEVTVLITPGGGGTDLLIRHERLRRDDAIARHAEGWRGAVELLVGLLRGGSEAP